MHPGLFDMFHDAAEQPLAGAITDGVNIDLGGVFEEAIDQHGTVSR